jgi:TetR/AcrR family transcriptional repressor of lmrAB and yxaGH operons
MRIVIVINYDDHHSQTITGMAGDIRQKMIERTAILLAQKGLQGTSFTDILAASGAPRGSLYHHFPGGKDELVLAAVSAAGNRAITVLDSLAGRPADEVAAAFAALWRLVLEKSNFSAGCAVVAVTVAATTPELTAHAADVFRRWRHRLAELLTQGSVPASRAPALAATLIAAHEGAVILARAERSFEPFDEVAAEQVAAVRAAMKGGGNPGTDQG